MQSKRLIWLSNMRISVELLLQLEKEDKKTDFITTTLLYISKTMGAFPKVIATIEKAAVEG